jgi:Fe-S cluster assembly protein SufD
MTEATLTPAAALAERVIEATRSAGQLDVAPGRKAMALATLDRLGYPTTRDERWKYTRVARIQQLPLTPAPLDANAAPAVLNGMDAHRLTFVNGRFVRGERVDASGAFIAPLSDAAESCPERLAALESDHFADNEWFAALQAAAPQDGGAVLIPDGVTLDKPVLVHHHLTAGTHAAQPQHLIVLGREAKAEVILWTTCDPGADGLYNGAIAADLGEHAHLSLEIVQDEHGAAHHIGHHQFKQAASSKLEVRTATACAHWLRNDLHIQQGGQYGDSTFHGCYLPSDQQFVDHHTRIDHAMPDGRSDELYKGLASGSATAVFNGKIMVHPDAQRIEAYQSNANLILGEKAAINAKPELEIYADDVRCSHGCTTGQFDGEALFYLRSRGMTETAARNLLVRAFLAEVLDGFRPEIQAHVESVYAERLGWN